MIKAVFDAFRHYAHSLRQADAPDFGDIPQLSGCVACLKPDNSQASASVSDFYHGVFQATVTYAPGAVFVAGFTEKEVFQRYPMAQPIEPADSIGRASMTPSSAMAMLRALFGPSLLSDHIWDLFYLEQAGNEMDKPGPLAMIPEWVEHQLQPETISALFTGMQRHDATVGAALRALMQQESFSFSFIDALQAETDPQLSAQGALSESTLSALQSWKAHAKRVVEVLREVIDNPPLALRYLPAIRQAQKSNAPGVYFIPEEALTTLYPVLDALVLSAGKGVDHYWLIDLDALSANGQDAMDAAARLGSSLWQTRGDESLGGRVWWLTTVPPDLHGQTKSFHHRCIQGCTYLVGPLGSVDKAAASSLHPTYESQPELQGDDQLGAMRLTDHACRHFAHREMSASRFHGQETARPKNVDRRS